MDTHSRPKSPHPLAPRPRHRRERDAQPIPREAPATNAELNWRPGELIVGGPRPARKSTETSNA